MRGTHSFGETAGKQLWFMIAHNFLLIVLQWIGKVLRSLSPQRPTFACEEPACPARADLNLPPPLTIAAKLRTWS